MSFVQLRSVPSFISSSRPVSPNPLPWTWLNVSKMATGKTSEYKSAVGINESLWSYFISVILLDLIYCLLQIIPALLLDRIIDFTIHDFYSWRGYFYASLIFLIDLFSRTIVNYSDFLIYVCGIQIESSLMGTVYRKNLYMSPAVRKDYNSGTLMSLLSVDIKRIQWFSAHISALLVLPIRIFVIVFVMWQYVGVSTAAGVAVVVLLFPVSFFVSRIGGKFSDKQMGVKDRRLKLMNEILNGIKILKLYAWEIPFLEGCQQLEMKKSSGFATLSSATLFLLSCSLLCSFHDIRCNFCHISVNRFEQCFKSNQSFCNSHLMEQLKSGLFHLPDAIADLIQANVSIKRLRQFLYCENKDKTVIGNNLENGEAVTIKEASFSWTVLDLSGGQKLRVNLAQAVYQDKDIYLPG
ncbi:multidrug resistance-associated protein 1 [Caerostris extrusa]|uniref:Multidrug resistance-associated protein 1 n=1 Tax=Caerostris extrusa TaxID=172846 RepID=A0AAV4PUB2_CAEEX|nr:multidrug resistance-associated protein 1 [Caerostris extrusa]